MSATICERCNERPAVGVYCDQCWAEMFPPRRPALQRNHGFHCTRCDDKKCPRCTTGDIMKYQRHVCEAR